MVQRTRKKRTTTVSRMLRMLRLPDWSGALSHRSKAILRPGSRYVYTDLCVAPILRWASSLSTCLRSHISMPFGEIPGGSNGSLTFSF